MRSPEADVDRVFGRLGLGMCGAKTEAVLLGFPADALVGRGAILFFKRCLVNGVWIKDIDKVIRCVRNTG